MSTPDKTADIVNRLVRLQSYMNTAEKATFGELVPVVWRMMQPYPISDEAVRSIISGFSGKAPKESTVPAIASSYFQLGMISGGPSGRVWINDSDFLRVVGFIG